jgi:molecular chaperone DnaJ
MPVNFATLALGGKLEVPLLGGGTASVDVAAGTASGQVTRVKGKGLPGLRGGRGDLQVRLRVWVPSKLSAPERKQLEELRRGEGLQPPKPSRTLFDKVRDGFGG